MPNPVKSIIEERFPSILNGFVKARGYLSGEMVSHQVRDCIQPNRHHRRLV